MVLMDKESFDKTIQLKYKFFEKPLLISMLGLCGSGKTTLSNKLKKFLKAEVVNIGRFRVLVKKINDFFKKNNKDEKIYHLSIDQLLEMKAWAMFYHDCLWHLEQGKNVIIDTSGLNKRLRFFLDELRGLVNVVEIKLVCPLKILEKRVNERTTKQNGFFPYEFDGHIDFNKVLSKYFKEKKADIVINTGKLNKEQVYKKAVEKLKKYIAKK